MNFDIECGDYIEGCQYSVSMVAMSTTLLQVTDVTDTSDGACCTPLTRETIDADRAEDLARKLKALADPDATAAGVDRRRIRR